jgi:hypothetical protein
MTEPCLPLSELLALAAAAGRQPAEKQAGVVTPAPAGMPAPAGEQDSVEMRNRPEDSRWIHLRSCPRCRSLLAEYEAFAAIGEPAQGQVAPGEEEAAHRLQNLLKSRIQEPRPPAPARPAQARRSSPWWSRFLIPALGATAVLAGAFLMFQDRLLEMRHPSALRGLPEASMPGSVATLPPHWLERGIELSWRRSPEADAYRVRILNAGLQELRAFPAGSDTMLILDPLALTRLAGAAFWQVEALSRGDQLGESTPARLPPTGR